MPRPDEPEDRPKYTKYRAGRRAPGGRREPRPPQPGPRPDSGHERTHRGHDDGMGPISRYRPGGRRGGHDQNAPDHGRSGRRLRIPGARLAGRSGRFTLRWLLGRIGRLAICWVAISLIVFLVSAQIHQTGVGGGGLLGGGGYPLTSPNTILVLGSDARPKGKGEPGSGGPSRSDSIMLLRTGGGASRKLSIPRDTLVPIPGHGTDKVNAAYAYGGTDLAVRTLEDYLGLQINHVIEVNFENFPELIDAMGGVTYKGSCVVSKINGGFKNGGYTLRLKSGRTHIDGRQALALARTRKNLCNPRENDLARARRQQKLLSAMKWRMMSPMAFVRLPWISWSVPKALRSDMSGPTLFGVFGGLMIGGGGKTTVLKPNGVATTSSGGAALTVDEASKRRAVQRFLRG